MISKELSKKIITVGPRYKRPLGGIAQVMNNFSKYVFEEYRVVVNSGGSMLRKTCYLIKGLFEIIFLLICDRKIRIVHIHTSSRNSFSRSSIFVYISKFFNKKVILHIHSGDFIEYYQEKSEYVRKTLAKCDVVIELTPTWKQMLEEVSGLSNIVVLDNLIPKPSILNEKYDDGLIHFLCLARITKSKGIFDLIECINKCQSQLRNKAIFHIAGNGQSEEMMLLVDKYHINDIVKYEGWVSGNAKISILNKCDIFILPTHFDAFPLSIMEAMSYRKPIVATRVGGIPTMVEDKKNGLMFEKGDIQGLINCIMYFIENPENISVMGKNSEIIVSNYYPEQIIPKLQGIYESLL